MGVDAKPIIDIAIGMYNIERVVEVIRILEHQGFKYQGDSGENGGHLIVKEIEPLVRTHHIHIVDLQDPQWKNYLHFRDTLRSDKDLRNEYQTLKSNLAKKYPHDRRAYTDGKHNFIRGILSANKL